LNFLNDILKQAIGTGSTIVSSAPVSGGCISKVSKLKLKCGTSVLAKLAGEANIGFHAEAEGLSAIAETQTMATPEIIAVGESPEPYLILDWIDTAPIQTGFWRRLGANLAALHSAETPSPQFGFTSDNVIGASPQINKWASSWSDFFCDRRLRYQFDLARKAGYFSENEAARFEGMLSEVAVMLEEVPTQPSLIHGDLWNGNFLCDKNQRPVVIDPAVSYSHGEAELSIMKMFGGFDQACFDAYHEIRPAHPAIAATMEIYSLYHYLNHLNLFGRSYLVDCRRIINKFV
jgi:fructosamine-3-kinase